MKHWIELKNGRVVAMGHHPDEGLPLTKPGVVYVDPSLHDELSKVVLSSEDDNARWVEHDGECYREPDGQSGIITTLKHQLDETEAERDFYHSLNRVQCEVRALSELPIDATAAIEQLVASIRNALQPVLTGAVWARQRKNRELARASQSPKG